VGIMQRGLNRDETQSERWTMQEPGLEKDKEHWYLKRPGDFIGLDFKMKSEVTALL